MARRAKPQVTDSEDTTVWTNNKDVDVHFRLCVGESSHCPIFKDFRIPKGQSLRIRSEFDHAIRKEVNGIIMGGVCPWLLKNDETEVTNLHPALDFEKVEERLKVNQLAEEIKELKAQSEARELLAQRETKTAK